MSITFGHKAAYADTNSAQPHEHREYCWTRQFFSVVAEQCSCEIEQEMWRPEDEEHADAWWMTSGSGTEGCWTKSPRRGREQVRTVVPLEVPRDTRICIEDLADMDIEQSRAMTAARSRECVDSDSGDDERSEGAKNEKVEEVHREWRKSTERGRSPPRVRKSTVRTKEQGTRVQVFSSFAKLDKTNEQKKKRK